MLYFLPVILYVSYIGVGLPNGILSAAWPTMHESLGASVEPYIVAYALETGGCSPIYPCIIHMTPAYILALTLGMIVLHELLHRRYTAQA